MAAQRWEQEREAEEEPEEESEVQKRQFLKNEARSALMHWNNNEADLNVRFEREKDSASQP